MIEIIYSEEANEKEEKSTDVRLPRNVRQIGKGNENKKIYVEDYVMTYIGRIWEVPKAEPSIGILLGTIRRAEGGTYLFISGAITIENIVQSGKDIIFSDETWTEIYETIKKYFNNLEIMGWFLARNDSAFEIDESLYKTHIDNFAGIDKLLLLADVNEKEEEFYVFNNGQLEKQDGYYIYYEKNEPMQAYMVEKKQGKSIEEVKEDKITESYRTIIQEKKENTSQKKMVGVLYSACTFLAVVVLAIGVTLMNNYDKMRNMETTLNTLTMNLIGENQKNDGIPVANNTIVDKVDGLVETTVLPENTSNQLSETNEAVNTQSDTTPQTTQPPTETQFPTETQPPTETQAPTEAQTSEEESQQSEVATAQFPTTQIENTNGTYHTVTDGETLTSISLEIYQTDTMVETIMQANNIEDGDKIYPGQKIYLP